MTSVLQFIICILGALIDIKGRLSITGLTRYKIREISRTKPTPLGRNVKVSDASHESSETW